MFPTPEIVAAIVFALAVLHTFSTKVFAHLAHSSPGMPGLWHLLAEVEVVFGFWAFVLVIALLGLTGKTDAVDYMESRNFTEPMFVFVIMVIAASRPVLEVCGSAVRAISPPASPEQAPVVYFLCLSLIPLLGSFITEPAAMTLAALMLRDRYFANGLSARFKYATLGVLFVNVSIGGTLTSFGAPPVLMVAATWQWDTPFMFATFGWKAALAVVVNALACSLFFRSELRGLPEAPGDDSEAAGAGIGGSHSPGLSRRRGGLCASSGHFHGLVPVLPGLCRGLRALPKSADLARRAVGGLFPCRVGGAGGLAAVVAAANPGRCRADAALLPGDRHDGHHRQRGARLTWLRWYRVSRRLSSMPSWLVQ